MGKVGGRDSKCWWCSCHVLFVGKCFRGTSEFNSFVSQLIFDGVLLVINSGTFCYTIKAIFVIL